MKGSTVNRFAYSISHDIGKIRPVNEDAIFAFTAQIMRFDTIVPIGLFIIADGMGGHASGEKASASAISEFTSEFFSEIYPKFINGKKSADDFVAGFQAAIERTNATVHRKIPNSGTTFSALFLFGNQYLILHIGDSRVYRLEPVSEPELLTKDHTLVQMMIDLGEISEEEGKNHPRRNVILKSVGYDNAVSPDIFSGKFSSGDRFFLCCDGVWSVVGRDPLNGILISDSTIQEQTEKIVKTANGNGGPDNISCILVQTE